MVLFYNAEKIRFMKPRVSSFGSPDTSEPSSPSSPSSSSASSSSSSTESDSSSLASIDTSKALATAIDLSRTGTRKPRAAITAMPARHSTGNLTYATAAATAAVSQGQSKSPTNNTATSANTSRNSTGNDEIEKLGLPGFANNTLFSDISFIVGSEGHQHQVFHGHRVLFSSKSPVFLAMFTSDLPIKDNTIRIEDSQPRIFQHLMNYIYKGDSEEFGSNIGFEAAIKLAYLAKKYMMDDLTNKCLSYILHGLSQQLTIKNVLRYWTLLMVHLPDSYPAMERIEDFIDRNAEQLIMSPEFLEINQFTLCKFLERDSLKVKNESDVFIAVVNWARERCFQQKTPSFKKYIRENMGDALYQIRFTTMDFYVFSTIVSPENILVDEETQEILMRMNSVVAGKDEENATYAYKFPFNTVARGFTIDVLKAAKGIKRYKSGETTGGGGVEDEEYPLPSSSSSSRTPRKLTPKKRCKRDLL